ncbi:hypothetical protein HDV57DRAFT_410568 [Trichoderma longibrachiatum]
MVNKLSIDYHKNNGWIYPSSTDSPKSNIWCQCSFKSVDSYATSTYYQHSCSNPPYPGSFTSCCLIVRNPGSDTAATRISSSIVHCPIRSNPSSFPASRHSNILSQSIDQLTAENTSCKSSKRAPYTLPARRHVRSIQHIPWRHCPRRFSPHSVSHPPRR